MNICTIIVVYVRTILRVIGSSSFSSIVLFHPLDIVKPLQTNE